MLGRGARLRAGRFRLLFPRHQSGNLFLALLFLFQIGCILVWLDDLCKPGTVIAIPTVVDNFAFGSLCHVFVM